LARKIKLSKSNKGDKDYVTARMRAKQFGVSLHIVKDIDCGKSWGHLPDKDGNPSPSTAATHRKRRKAAKERIWTAKDFEKARENLESKSKIDPNSPVFEGSHCIRWSGYFDVNGYGTVSANGRHFFAHVLAWCVENNTLERNELQICHSCGNKSCVNSKHLRLGTAAENQADRIDHGTSNHKLDIGIADEIRLEYKTGNYSQEQLGQKFGLCRGTIGEIVTNKIYTNPKLVPSGSESAVPKIEIMEIKPKPEIIPAKVKTKSETATTKANFSSVQSRMIRSKIN
jgi:hypothetical protein